MLSKTSRRRGRLRAAINFGNAVLAQRDPVTGEPRGVSVELARALGQRLGVWSRDEVVRVDLERSRVFCPGLADRLERGSPSEPLQVFAEVVGRDKGQDVGLQALQV